MLKTISAAMLAVSVLATPVLAASADKTAQAPVSKTTQAPVIKADQAKSKSKALNANARMGHKHYRHHRHHEKMGALKTHVSPKLAIKHVTPTAKRG
jgi:Ni/Co efflux regulator RcnB